LFGNKHIDNKYIKTQPVFPGMPDSPVSLGDQKANQGLAPASSLNFKKADDISSYQDRQPVLNRPGGPLQLDANITPPTIFQLPKTDPQPNGVLPINPNLADVNQNLYSPGGPNVGRPGPYSGMFPSILNSFDIFSIAHWFRNVSSQVLNGKSFEHDPVTKEGRFVGPNVETINKSRQWLATNFLLAALNPGDIQSYGPGNMVFNPLSLQYVGQVPLRGLASAVERPTLGVLTYKDLTKLTADTPVERLPLIRKGLYFEVSPGHRISQLRSPIPVGPGFIGSLNGPNAESMGDENPMRLFTPTTVETITNGNTDNAAALLGAHTNLYNQERPYNLSNAVMPLEKFQVEFEREQQVPPAIQNGIDLKTRALFDAKPFPGSGFLNAGNVLTYMAKPSISLIRNRGIKVKDLPTNVDVAFNTEDEDNGYVTSQVDPGVKNDENYMPFVFQDLRIPDQFLYFRAFLQEGLAETFSPEWNEDRYYGRVDPVPTYIGTTRTIDLSFDVVAWSPKDLPVMYKKLQKLQSMVYPLYDEEGFLKSGPIIRMRIGDLICGKNNKGLPGFITSMDFSYDESVWNIQKDFKSPRKVTVSLGYTVLHEANPGLYPQGEDIKFGVAQVVKDNDKFKLDKFSTSEIRKIFGTARGEN
jgi:hypothetical protein